MSAFEQKRSYGSVKVCWLDKEGLIDALKEKAQDALECFSELRKVVLFDSLARWEATPRPDADLLFVVEEAGPFLEQPARYLPFFEDLGFPVDLLVYTEPELERVLLAKRALKEGRVLAVR